MKFRGALLACLAASTAYADGKHTLVLKADGNAEGKVRTQVDAAILKLARGGVEGVAAGDISFGDAAAAVGCKPDVPTCKDDVLGMFSVDEIIATTVTRKPGGFEVVVRRMQKTGAPREVTAKVNDAADPQLDAQLGPLFGAATVTPPPVAVIEPVKPDGPPSDTTTPDVPPPDTTPPPQQPQPLPVLPTPVDDQSHTRLEIAGMVGGGAIVLLGFVMWGQAAGTQNDINAAPSGTLKQLQALQELEKQGDNQSSLGNLFFVSGLVLGGVSTYFFIRDRGRRHSDPVARIVPTVFAHGAGVAFTFGGLP